MWGCGPVDVSRVQRLPTFATYSTAKGGTTLSTRHAGPTMCLAVGSRLHSTGSSKPTGGVQARGIAPCTFCEDRASWRAPPAMRKPGQGRWPLERDRSSRSASAAFRAGPARL